MAGQGLRIVKREADPAAAPATTLRVTHREPRVAGVATIAEQLAAREAAAATANVTPPPGMHARPGGRGTGLNIREYDEAASGFASTVPFSGVEAPDTAHGQLGRAAGVAALAAFPVTRIASAARGAEAAGVVPAVVAGAKEAVVQGTPIVKYEVIKGSLEALGVPSAAAMVAAGIASGYRPGAKPKAAAAVVDAAATARAEAAAAARAPAPVVPVPPAVRTGTAWSAPPPVVTPPPVAAAPPGPTVADLTGARPVAPLEPPLTPAVGRPWPPPRSVAPAPATEMPVAPAAAPVAPVAAPPAPAAAPRGAARPGDTIHLGWADRTRGQQSAAWVANDLGIAARRAGATLTPEQYAAAGELVTTGGRTPAQAVEAVRQLAPAPVVAPPVVAPPVATAPAPAKPRLTLDEAREVGRLRAAGRTAAEIEAVLEAQRALSAMTPSQMRVAIANRRGNRSATRD